MFFCDGFYFCTCLVVSFDTHVERNFLIMISHFFMMNKFEFYLNPFLPDPGLFFSLNQVYLSLKQRGSYHKQASHTCLNEMSQAMLNRVVFCKDFVAKKT